MAKRASRALGKKVSKPENFLVKPVLVKKQKALEKYSRRCAVVTRKGRTLEETLSQTQHHNASVRRDTYANIYGLLKEGSLQHNADYLLSRVLKGCIDPDQVVRSTFRKIVSYILAVCLKTKPKNTLSNVSLHSIASFALVSISHVDCQLRMEVIDLLDVFHEGFIDYLEEIVLHLVKKLLSQAGKPTRLLLKMPSSKVGVYFFFLSEMLQRCVPPRYNWEYMHYVYKILKVGLVLLDHGTKARNEDFSKRRRGHDGSILGTSKMQVSLFDGNWDGTMQLDGGKLESNVPQRLVESICLLERLHSLWHTIESAGKALQQDQAEKLTDKRMRAVYEKLKVEAKEAFGGDQEKPATAPLLDLLCYVIKLRISRVLCHLVTYLYPPEGKLVFDSIWGYQSSSKRVIEKYLSFVNVKHDTEHILGSVLKQQTQSWSLNVLKKIWESSFCESANAFGRIESSCSGITRSSRIKFYLSSTLLVTLLSRRGPDWKPSLPLSLDILTLLVDVRETILMNLQKLSEIPLKDRFLLLARHCQLLEFLHRLSASEPWRGPGGSGEGTTECFLIKCVSVIAENTPERVRSALRTSINRAESLRLVTRGPSRFSDSLLSHIASEEAQISKEEPSFHQRNSKSCSVGPPREALVRAKQLDFLSVVWNALFISHEELAWNPPDPSNIKNEECPDSLSPLAMEACYAPMFCLVYNIELPKPSHPFPVTKQHCVRAFSEALQVARSVRQDYENLPGTVENPHLASLVPLLHRWVALCRELGAWGNLISEIILQMLLWSLDNLGHSQYFEGKMRETAIICLADQINGFFISRGDIRNQIGTDGRDQLSQGFGCLTKRAQELIYAISFKLLITINYSVSEFPAYFGHFADSMCKAVEFCCSVQGETLKSLLVFLSYCVACEQFSDFEKLALLNKISSREGFESHRTDVSVQAADFLEELRRAFDTCINH